MSGWNILHINTETGFRGGEIQNLYLADGLRERGHHPVLVCQPGSGLAIRAADRGLETHEGPMNGEFDVGAIAWLARLLRREAPDLVHYHTSHAITLGTMARWSRRLPRTVATRRTSFPPRRNPLFRLKFTFRVNVVITVSGSIRDELQAAGVPSERLAVVHSGIDLDRFQDVEGAEEFRREIEVEPSDVLVGCVAALARSKGQWLLLRAMAGLAPRFPRLHLALVGTGEMTAELLDEARGLGIGDRVHLAGFRDDVPAATAAFDVAALPSIAGEGSPAALKEAMASGVPVVATDVGGVREILDDGVQGLVVPSGDEAALAAALERLVSDADLRRRLGRAGRERAREYSMERMIDQTEAVYARLIDDRSRR